MNRLFPIAFVLAIGFTTVAFAATISNPSFEQPVTASFVYDPLDPTLAWSFSGRSGVASNTFFSAPPPAGTQAAFIQQFVDQPSTLSSVSQSLSGLGLTSATLSFYLAQRPSFAANPIVVRFGAQNLGTFTPSSTAFQQITVNFTPTAGSGQLVFESAATTNGELDTALDLVSLTQVGSATPEPATLSMMGAGMLALAALARKLPR